MLKILLVICTLLLAFFLIICTIFSHPSSFFNGGNIGKFKDLNVKTSNAQSSKMIERIDEFSRIKKSQMEELNTIENLENGLSSRQKRAVTKAAKKAPVKVPVIMFKKMNKKSIPSGNIQTTKKPASKSIGKSVQGENKTTKKVEITTIKTTPKITTPPTTTTEEITPPTLPPANLNQYWQNFNMNIG